METMFFDLASPVRMDIGPSNLPSKFFGSQAWPPVSPALKNRGASLITVVGVNPFSNAAE